MEKFRRFKRVSRERWEKSAGLDGFHENFKPENSLFNEVCSAKWPKKWLYSSRIVLPRQISRKRCGVMIQRPYAGSMKTALSSVNSTRSVACSICGSVEMETITGRRSSTNSSQDSARAVALVRPNSRAARRRFAVVEPSEVVRAAREISRSETRCL